MFILINSTCFGHYYAHHQEKRLRKQLRVEYAYTHLNCYDLSSPDYLDTTLHVFPCYRHTPHAVVYIVCSPDDGHNNARNMLS